MARRSGSNPLQIIGQSELRQGEDQPLGGIKVVPPRSIAIVAKERVVIVMVALPEGHEGHPPTVPTAVSVSMWLSTPEMTDGVDAKRGVEHEEHTAHAGHQKAGPDPSRAFETPMRDQAVIAHRDTESAGHIQHAEHDPVERRKADLDAEHRHDDDRDQREDHK